MIESLFFCKKKGVKIRLVRITYEGQRYLDAEWWSKGYYDTDPKSGKRFYSKGYWEGASPDTKAFVMEKFIESIIG